MRSLSIMRAIAALVGVVPTDKAHTLQKEFFGSGYKGRPRINSDRPKPRERDTQYTKSRHKKLPIFLKQVWSVPKTKPTRKPQREQRIIDITARRFNVQPEQQFPLEAIILMADKGVTKAKEQYYKLAKAAEYNNISVRQAYDHFVLGKELPKDAVSSI